MLIRQDKETSVNFPGWVESTPCKYRSQTVMVRDNQHGMNRVAIRVSNANFPMEMEKRMGFPSVTLGKMVPEGRDPFEYLSDPIELSNEYNFAFVTETQ